MKTKTMSVLLAVTLLGFSFGFFRPAGVLAGGMRLAEQQTAKVVHELRSFPSLEEQKMISQWIGEARPYSEQINFSLSKEGNQLRVTLTSDEEEITDWLQEHFSMGQDSLIRETTSGMIASRVEYNIYMTEGGVIIEISSDDGDFITDLYEKLKKTAS